MGPDGMPEAKKLTYLTCLQVLQAFARAEKRLKPTWTEMFSEVYDEMPTDLRCVVTYTPP